MQVFKDIFPIVQDSLPIHCAETQFSDRLMDRTWHSYGSQSNSPLSWPSSAQSLSRSTSGDGDWLIGSPCPSINEMTLLPPGNGLGNHMRLFFHFATTVVGEMLQFSPFFHGDAHIWQTHISTMAFANPSLLHVILALAAKDLEMKSTSNRPESLKYRLMRESHEGQALSSLASELKQGTTSEQVTPWTILLLIWLSIISDRHQTATEHFEGIRPLIFNLSSTTFSSKSGREMSRLFLALDMTRASMRNISTRPMKPISSWLTKRLAVECSQADDLDEYLFYTMLDIVSRLPSLPFCTYLQLATRRCRVSDEKLAGLERMFSDLEAWRENTRRSPAFRSTTRAARTRGHDKITLYADPKAAMLMAYYYWILSRLYDEALLFYVDSAVLKRISIHIQQIVRGAIDQWPSTYSSIILNSKGALNIFRPLYCSTSMGGDIGSDSLGEQVLALPGRQSPPTILNLNVENFLGAKRAISKCWQEHFATDETPVFSFMREHNLRQDFELHDYYYPEDLDSETSQISYYGLIIGDGELNTPFVLNRFVVDGKLVFEPDREMTEYWKQKILEYHTMQEPVVQDTTVPELAHRIEAILRTKAVD